MTYVLHKIHWKEKESNKEKLRYVLINVASNSGCLHNLKEKNVVSLQRQCLCTQ
jgi:hypothetical protein